VKRLESMGMDVPDDYPADELDAVHALVTAVAGVNEAGLRPAAWHEWASAMNGLAWRFRACDEHGIAVVESLRSSHAPEIEDRYHQEKWLFAFFFEGLSAVECLYYGLYFVGALTESPQFDPGVDPRTVKTGYVAQQFSAAFPSDLAAKLTEVARGEEFKLWTLIRNVLAHRGVPARNFSIGGEHSGAVLWGLPEAAEILDPDELLQRRENVGSMITQIAEVAVPFVQEHLADGA